MSSFVTFFLFYSFFQAFVAAQSSIVVCIAGQCLEGYSNVTIGVKLRSPNVPVPVQLLPGTYTSSTNPQLLHQLLTSSSPSIEPSAGFENVSSAAFASSKSAINLPLGVALEPGMAVYSQQNYSGQAAFSNLPSTPTTNTSIPLTALSFALSSDVWAAISLGSGNQRTILWDSVPDATQLPSLSSLTLLDLQSSSCNPPCSSSGVCSQQGTCTCPPGFTGNSCEQCATGFFGTNCTSCSGQSSGCSKCDDGLSGTGRCLQSTNSTQDSVTQCNCLNGVCGSNGQCACATGWTTAANGQACAKCTDGFFLTSTSECKVCQLGCAKCSDNTGSCISCRQGYTQDPNDPTKCNSTQATTSTGSPCPDGSFSNGAQCSACSPTCKTCTGSTSNDCAVCANGKYMFNGSCVAANSVGVCDGTNGMIADNNKKECDTCGPHCSSCQIPAFTVASTVNQAQCTGCLPGYFLANGQCVQNCPTGMFVSSQNNQTCTACNSECATCTGSADFCLSCPNNGLVFNGKCVTSCPSNTVSGNPGNGTICLSCHPDCATCSGTSFTQCSSCPPTRPVLSNGRCLPTCNRGQFFDPASKACQQCDSSCASCAGSSNNQCLSCSADKVLRNGACVPAACDGQTETITGLGICLSDLVNVPKSSGTSGTPGGPLPTISGLTQPVPAATKGSTLAWWQILLMAFGCAFICLILLLLWRRRARRNRAQRTAMFARSKGMDGKWWWGTGWRARFVALFRGERPKSKRQESVDGDVDLKERFRDMEEGVGMEKEEEWWRRSIPSVKGRRDVSKWESGLSGISGISVRRAEARQPVKDGPEVGKEYAISSYNPFRQDSHQ
ncbi:hypothetical protein M378DRAFT_190887 [Amanita muscaria Koide BX008]|uniref:EGF-like domain-containing protein n=1 Tax=Amanita muscaria (strain Koide BX008) TaxID=946122 RepID=A0A0C2XHP5_AMAMK|nr:hypothetical protein M378DRAFT_190887 [Amanita muscaria Koide BX008]